MQLELRPFVRSNGTIDFPVIITVGETYVFCADRYKANMLLYGHHADYGVSMAYISHLAEHGFETLITEDMIVNKANHIATFQWIRAYGKVKQEITSEQIWDKLAADYEKDHLNGVG